MPIHPNARRCIYYRLNATRCGSPALLGKPRCFHHDEIIKRRSRMKVPFLKNTADLQQAVVEVIEGLVTKRLARPDATAILYALQLAQSNLKLGGVRHASPEAEAESSLIRQLLHEVDAIEELEDDAENVKSEYDHKEFEETKKLIEEQKEKRKA